MNENLKHGGEEAIDRTNKEAEAAEEERRMRWLKKLGKVTGIVIEEV